MGRAEARTYRGRKYRRYPDAQSESDRRYFRAAGGAGYLHRHIWEEAHGPIPPDHEIHHRDRDPSNNDVANLACIPRGQHKSFHGAGRTLEGDHLDAMLSGAAEWHGSDEGRTWHSEHAKRSWANRTPAKRTCAHCGGAYVTTSRRQADRFCSNACKAAARRASGVDDEPRTCAHCGAEFTTNKHRKVRHCSRACSSAASWVRRRLRPDD